MMNVGSLFSGIGGIELGFKRAGFETSWFVEWEPYAQAVLRKHWPEAQIHADITKVDFSKLPHVDVLTGGFPCQDISRANAKRVGIKGKRSGLWSYYCEAIRILRPRYVFIENVTDIIKPIGGDHPPIQTVLRDLSAIGYDAEWYSVPAFTVGANTLRWRTFIIAYMPGGRLQGIHEEFTKAKDSEPYEISKEVLDAWHYQLPEPPLLGTGSRFPQRMERIRGLGNAVIPQIAEIFARAIKEIEATKI